MSEAEQTKETTGALPRPTQITQTRRLLLALCALLPLAVFVGYSVVVLLEGRRETEIARLRDVGAAIASNVDEHLAARQRALRILASSRLLDQTPIDATAFQARVRPISEELGGWVILQTAPPEQEVLINQRWSAAAGLPHPRTSESYAATLATNEEVFGQQRAAVSNLFTGPVVHQLVYNVAVPVIRDEQVRYALILAQTTDGLRGLLHSQTLRGGDFAFILDGQHRIVANSLSDAGLNGEFAPPWMRAALGSSQPSPENSSGLADMAQTLDRP